MQHTAAEFDLDQIWTLVDEFLDAHRDRLPEGLARRLPDGKAARAA